MFKDSSFLHSRSLWVYYTLFFSGASVLIYQALGWDLVGDSVNFLCLLFVLNGFLARRKMHILENTFLMTVGYILPLLIRNSLKLSYVEAPSMREFLKLGLVSTGTTLALGCVFSFLGYALVQGSQKFAHLSRGKVSTRSLHEDR